MWRSSPIVFRQGFITAATFAGLLGTTLACSDADIIRPIAAPPSEAAGGDGGEAPEPGVSAPEPPEPALPTVIAERVTALFERSCVECHGQGMTQGGLGDLPDLTTLIETGQIVPGRSATSPLIVLLRSDHVPNRLRRPVVGEVALVERFIDELPALAHAPCEPLALMDPDAQLAAMLADAARLDAGLLPFTRYLTLTYASNAGTCGAALERERHALSASINGVSTALEVRRPEPIDESALIYRIDTRDYGWNRPLDLEDDGTVDFADGWLAIAAEAGELALAFDGPEADGLERLTQTRVPQLPANAFLAAASRGDLYYALTNQSAELYETETRLGIDIEAASIDGSVSRAGFQGGERGRNELIAMRFEQGGASALAYWLLADFGDGNRGGSIYSDPLSLNPSRIQGIFHLPNGMLAFASADANWTRLDATPPTCQRCTAQRGNFVAAGCRGCHHTGLVPLEDTMRPYVEENRTLYDPQSFDVILEQYPPAPEMDQTLSTDTAFYLRALDRAGVPRDISDPVSAVYFEFERPLTLKRTAAELGVTADELEARLAELAGPLQILAIEHARLARADFRSGYRNALCMLLASARNRPEGCSALP